MKKQIIFIGIILAIMFFFLGWYFGGKSGTINNPEQTIRTSFGYLQENDLDSYKQSLASSDLDKKLIAKYVKKFKKVHDNPLLYKNFSWKGTTIEKITFKLRWSSEENGQYHCNAKIYFVQKKFHYKISFKNLIYKNGKWQGGVFSGITDLNMSKDISRGISSEEIKPNSGEEEEYLDDEIREQLEAESEED